MLKRAAMKLRSRSEAQRLKLHSFIIGAKTTILALGGFGSLDYAAFQWHTVIGWVAVGCTLLILEALSEGEPE